MNMRTKVSPSGDVTIPKDVRDRLAWEPGTPLELVETRDGVSLRAAAPARRFALKSLSDLQALSPAATTPQPVAAISRLSDEDIRRLLP
jgi:AbrB family looped-hinge helix DNA binding protein